MDKEYARPNNVFMLKPDVDFGELYEALTDRLSRIESMAAARVGENEGENSYGVPSEPRRPRARKS
jgi:hypothetical protein